MRKAGEIVTALFRDKFGQDFVETARQSAGLFSSWEQLATEVWPRRLDMDSAKGDVPAPGVHSRIRELERGVLLVEADHPGWIQILQTKQAELLSAVQRRYPELDIRGIAFRLSREPFTNPGAEENEVLHELPQADVSPDNPTSQGKTRINPEDEEFYAALKGLEESIKQRNNL